MTRPMVFVSCGAPVVPLLDALAERYVLVVPDAAIAERLCAAGQEAVPWQQFADAAHVAAIREAAPRLPDAWMARLEAADVAWGFGGRDRRAECLARMRAVVERTLAAQLLVGEIGRSLAATGRLAAVVLHEDVTAPVRALLAATSAAGVPSVHLPHGVYARERLVGADVHGVLHADVLAVGGSAQRDWFLARGVPADRIVVTGNPAWDRLHGVRRDAYPSLGLPPGPVATVATSWIGADSAHRSHVEALHARMTGVAIAAVTRVQRARPDLRLVLRPHPSAPPDTDTVLLRRAVEAGAAPDRIQRGDATAILARTDVLVTLPSTIAVEAILLGTPVVTTAFDYDGDAVRSTAVEVDAAAAAIAAALDERGAAFAARCADFATRYNGPSDGRASERVVALIDDLAARRTTRAAPDRLAAARRLAAASRWSDVVETLDGDERPDALAVRADALARLGRTGEAEPCFRAALAGGAGATAHAGLGLLLLERGSHDEAETMLRGAAALDAASDLAWCGLGVLAALRGDVDGAVPLLRRALELNPSNADARGALDALVGH